MMGERLEAVHTIQVEPLYIPWSGLYLGRYRLNSVQADAHRHIKAGHDTMIYAPTGAGKTLTLLLSPHLPGEDMPGFVAVYPNNTLLANQFRTVMEVIEDALEGRLLYMHPEQEEEDPLWIPMMAVYRIGEDTGIFPRVRHVVLLAASGRHLVGEEGEPKRETLYRLAEKVYKYDRMHGAYLIVFTTPDTFLLIYTGAYADFHRIGAALHNLLVGLASGKGPEELEYILRSTGALPREVEGPIIALAERLLAHPLFIDEFHLYGPYEVDALYAAIRLFKERTGLPVLFSSATPARDIISDLSGAGIRIAGEVSAPASRGGFHVRGPMKVHVVPAQVRGRGLAPYFRAGELVPSLVARLLVDKLRGLGGGERALIILDRLWMVTYTARVLAERGIRPRCIATIYDRDYCSSESSVIVSSEATTQGVNLGRVVLGVMSGVSAEDVIQRIGRVGRRGVESEVYLVIPSRRVEDEPPPQAADYYRLVDWISRAYPGYHKRKRDVSSLIPPSFHESRRKLIYALGVASISRVAGDTRLLSRIDLSPGDARRLLKATLGEPRALARLIVFRRTGFNVDYVDPKGRTGRSSIGLISRNFTVKDSARGRLVIDYTPSRNILVYRMPRVNPVSLKGMIVPLSLLDKLGGSMEIDDGQASHEVRPTDDTLVYIGDMGRELADYLSYTGEGAVIRHGTRGDYALVFI